VLWSAPQSWRHCGDGKQEPSPVARGTGRVIQRAGLCAKHGDSNPHEPSWQAPPRRTTQETREKDRTDCVDNRTSRIGHVAPLIHQRSSGRYAVRPGRAGTVSRADEAGGCLPTARQDEPGRPLRMQVTVTRSSKRTRQAIAREYRAGGRSVRLPAVRRSSGSPREKEPGGDRFLTRRRLTSLACPG